MSEVSMSVKLNASADEVWGLIGEYNALPDWHPMIAKSSLEDGGKVRRLEAGDGAVILERLEQMEDYSCTYTITESPLPISGYRATLSVRAEGACCIVEWGSQFTPDGASEEDVTGMIRGLYRAGLDALAKRFGAA